MLESIYRAAGLRVGLFTSPHLVSFRERIQVNRRLISEADVVRLVAELREQCRTGFQPVSTVKSPGPEQGDRRDACPTFFEVVTVMALRYFPEQQCDLVIWETGMGGRLDATNIVTPLASVITNIQLDHQQWLGNTRAEIAAEKAGIIKPGVPVITATDTPEALKAGCRRYIYSRCARGQGLAAHVRNARSAGRAHSVGAGAQRARGRARRLARRLREIQSRRGNHRLSFARRCAKASDQ